MRSRMGWSESGGEEEERWEGITFSDIYQLRN